MKPFKQSEWSLQAERMERVRRRLPTGAAIEEQHHEGGGYSFAARWIVPIGQLGSGVWEIVQPYLCLWVELRGPNGLLWTSRRPEVGLDWWRVLRVAEAMDAIPEEGAVSGSGEPAGTAGQP